MERDAPGGGEGGSGMWHGGRSEKGSQSVIQLSFAGLGGTPEKKEWMERGHWLLQ